MSQNPRRKLPESCAPVTGAWVVTVCDCMTLLLCFILLLLTFSSLEDGALDKLQGAMPGLSFDSIFPHRRTIRDALLPAADVQVDHTLEGSERPTEEEPKSIKNPKRSLVMFDTEAYRDLKVVRVPSRKLFHARGSVLKDEGKALLDVMASFVAPSRCQIIVAETSRDPMRPGSPDPVAAERAWSVMQYFIQGRKLSPDRFSLARGGSIAARERGGEPAVEIVLLTGGLYR